MEGNRLRPAPAPRPTADSIVALKREDLAEGSSLHDEIYAALREALIAGRFRPGEIFTLRGLADRFGTSLMPVRDALKRLVAERALDMPANRSVVVPLMSRARFQEILQVRLSLETMLSRRACERIDRDGIAELEVHNDRMHGAIPHSDVDTYLAANQRFHFRLYEAAGSQITLPIVEALWMQVGPFLHGVFTERGTKSARDDHAQILKALRRRDPLAAAEAVASDLGDAADHILASYEFITD